jgi:hypothetical protein
MDDGSVKATTGGDWIAEERGKVLEYLERQGIQSGQIGQWPAWQMPPYLAVWAAESFATPGQVGWWVISGAVPTDYVGFHEAGQPREVIRHFARQWAELSHFMLRGEPHPEMNVGGPDQWPELGDLLQRRAAILDQLAADDSVWEDDNT